MFVDDGTGVATPALLSEVSSAVDRVRPLGTTYSVTPPAVLPVAITMNIQLVAGARAQAVIDAVQQAALAWVNELPMGGILAISKLEAIAHSTSSYVASVLSTLVNNATLDIRAQAGSVFQPVSLTVTAS